jgi:N-methylhydantoinase A
MRPAAEATSSRDRSRQSLPKRGDSPSSSNGHRGENKRFEIVNVRMVATVPRLPHTHAMRLQEPHTSEEPAVRHAYFGPERGLMQTRVVSRAALAGQPLRGPLIVQEYDSTAVVPPDCTASLDAYGSIIIDVPATTGGATHADS